MAETPCQDAPTAAAEGDAARAARDARVLGLLRQLVRIKTEHGEPAPGAPFGEGCARALTFMLAECEARGFATHRVDDKIAWAEVGECGPLVAFPVHLDVIPATGAWSHDPYAAEIVDGVLYGRGCMDDKIGAAAMMELIGELAAEWREAGRELPCRLRIIFGTDEEAGMSDMHGYVEAGEEQPAMGFVPDAMFPGIRGEKARLHLRVSRAVPASCGVELAAGTMVNVVPDHAEATVDASAAAPTVLEALLADLPEGVEAERLATGVRVVAHGRAAHGSTPERGVSAANRLARHLVAAGVDELRAHGAVPAAAACGTDSAAAPLSLARVCDLLCADLTGAVLGVDVPDDTFGHTSMNLGLLSLSGGRLEAELDVRFGSGISTEDVAARVSAALGEAWEVEVVRSKPLHLVPADDPCLRALLAAYREVTGDDAEPEVMAGGTYASYLGALCAFGPKLPGTHSGAHGIDEHVSLENVSAATEVYRHALRNLVVLAAEAR